MDRIKIYRDIEDSDEQFNEMLSKYLKNDLDKSKYAEVADQLVPLIDEYKINSENQDAIVSMVIYTLAPNFIDNELVNYLYNALNGQMDKKTIEDKVKNTIVLMNEKLFLDCINDPNVFGANDGFESKIRTFCQMSQRELMRTIIHESLHQLTANDNNDIKDFKDFIIHNTLNVDTIIDIISQYKILSFNKRGVEIAAELDNYKYLIVNRPLNEAITEYLTKKTMGSLYPKPTYQYLVEYLELLVELGYIDDDTIIKAYINNSFGDIIYSDHLKDFNVLYGFNNPLSMDYYKKKLMKGKKYGN